MTRRPTALIALLTALATLAALIGLAAIAAPAPAWADDPADNPRLVLTQFENAGSGLCLDILYRGDINGSPAIQGPCPWALGFQMIMADWPYYFIVIRGDVPKCLEVEAFSTANFASVAQHDCNGGPHQRWRYLPSGFTGTSAIARWLSSSFMLQNEYSGKCLEIAGSSLTIGARVVQNDCYRGVNQLWFEHAVI